MRMVCQSVGLGTAAGGGLVTVILKLLAINKNLKQTHCLPEGYFSGTFDGDCLAWLFARSTSFVHFSCNLCQLPVEWFDH